MYSQAHHTIGSSMALGKSVLRSVPVSVSYLFMYLTLHRPLCDIPFWQYFNFMVTSDHHLQQYQLEIFVISQLVLRMCY